MVGFQGSAWLVRVGGPSAWFFGVYGQARIEGVHYRWPCLILPCLNCWTHSVPVTALIWCASRSGCVTRTPSSARRVGGSGSTVAGRGCNSARADGFLLACAGLDSSGAGDGEGARPGVTPAEGAW